MKKKRNKTMTEAWMEVKDDMKIPSHYELPITPIDFIEKNNLGFAQGNIIKYVCRFDKKGTPIEDLDKIIHYCNILKKRYE